MDLAQPNALCTTMSAERFAVGVDAVAGYFSVIKLLKNNLTLAESKAVPTLLYGNVIVAQVFVAKWLDIDYLKTLCYKIIYPTNMPE